MKLYYYYDQEADVLYFSQGKPSPKDEARETRDDVILRVNPKTGSVRGFTILNFSRRNHTGRAISLPIEAQLTPSRT